MVKIRLRRVGAKKQPSYRVVVADSRAPRDGRFIESIGHYNPRTHPPTVVIYEDRALYWLSVGAVPSEPVARFFEKLGLPEKLDKVRRGSQIDAVAAPRSTAPAAKRPARTAASAPAALESMPEIPAETAPVQVSETPVEAEAMASTAAAAVTSEAAAALGVAVEAEAALATESELESPDATSEPPAAGPAEVAPDVAPAELGLDALGLSSRVVKALEAAGLTTAAAVEAKLQEGDAALLELPGIGAKAVEEIRAKLVEHGLSG